MPETNEAGKAPINHHAILWAVFFLGFIIRAYGLSAQPPLDDEAAAAFSAANYLDNGWFGHVMWYHPPLRNFVIYLSGKVFGGYTAWGLRSGSVLFGSLTVPLLGYLAYELLGDRRAAGLASLFLCVDPLHISVSRQAFQEATTPFFIVAGVLAACRGLRREGVSYHYLAGILFCLASASKWHGLFPWVVSAAAYLLAPYIGLTEFKGRRVGRIWTFLAAYAALPGAIYTAVYIPWLFRGYSLADFADFQLWLVGNQYHYKGVEYGEQFLSRRAYEWFLRPVGWVEFVYYEGKSYLNIAMGNFLVWGLTLPSLYYGVSKWRRTGGFGTGSVVVLFLVSYLPLVFTARSIWVLAAVPVVIFAFILIGAAISDMIGRGKISGIVLALYLFVVIAVSALMYPMSTLRALEYPYLKPLADIYSPHGRQVK